MIFDLDGVLCRLDDEARIGHLSGVSGLTPDDVVAAIWGSGFEDRADRGQLDAAEYLREFGARVGKTLSRSDWVAYRRSGMTPHPDVLQIAARTAERVPVAVLTNNGHLLIEEIGVLFPEVVPIFGSQIWCSAQFGTCKPDPVIFAQVCRRLGTVPSRTLFVDDLEANVLGAESAGLNGHLFRSADALARRLAPLLRSSH